MPARLPRVAEQLRRPVRPAAVADRQARARHHRGLAQHGDRRVHRVPARARPRPGARSGERVPRRRRDPARPEGRRAPARRANWWMPRTSRCSRRATCCSPACCSTGRSKRRRPGSRAARGRVDPARARRCGWRRSTASRRPNSSGRSASTTSRRWRPWRLTPREIPVVGLDHLHAPLVSIREQAAHVVGAARAAGDPLTLPPARSPARKPRASSSRGSWPCSSCTGTRPSRSSSSSRSAS